MIPFLSNMFFQFYSYLQQKNKGYCFLVTGEKSQKYIVFLQSMHLIELVIMHSQ